ncbi:MAG: hypothetical protein ACLU77_10910 [Waltera sp.]
MSQHIIERPGMLVEMDVEKGAWFKVGINMQNNTDTDKIVYGELLQGVRISAPTN